MPKAFDECRAKGGRIITRKINDKKYIHVCYLNGKAYAGEIKNYKNEENK